VTLFTCIEYPRSCSPSLAHTASSLFCLARSGSIVFVVVCPFFCRLLAFFPPSLAVLFGESRSRCAARPFPHQRPHIYRGGAKNCGLTRLHSFSLSLFFSLSDPIHCPFVTRTPRFERILQTFHKFSLSLSFSFSLHLSRSLALSLSFLLSPSFTHWLALLLTVSILLSLILVLSFCHFLSLSLFLFLFLSRFLNPALSLFIFLSISRSDSLSLTLSLSHSLS